MSENRLKLNTEKTELLWVGSRHSLSQQGCCLLILQLGPDSIAAPHLSVCPVLALNAKMKRCDRKPKIEGIGVYYV